MANLRDTAVGILTRSDREERSLQACIGDALAHGEWKPSDRGFLQELCYGVMRRRLTLDQLIEQLARRPVARLDQLSLQTLRIGAYQILFMDGVPKHAAVFETVQVAKRGGGPGRAGLVNAVLRRLAEATIGPVPYADIPDPRRIVPWDAARGIGFRRPFFPDPNLGLSLHLGMTYSYPPWLVDRWLARFGPERTRELLAAGNAVPPLFIRANTLRNSPDELEAWFGERKVPAQRIPGTPCFRVASKGEGAVSRLPGFEEGRWTVQDLTAASVVPLLDARPGHRVLDVAAGPGGKTTQIGEAMEGKGAILALDASMPGLRKVHENCARLGIGCAIALQARGEALPLAPTVRFDRILLDAPCSNTGVLARRVEARWRLSPEAITEMARLQSALLDSAAAHLAPGGILVYSTCSIEPEENSGAVDSFLERHPEFRKESEAETLPSATGGDGGYRARLSGPAAHPLP